MTWSRLWLLTAVGMLVIGGAACGDGAPAGAVPGDFVPGGGDDDAGEGDDRGDDVAVGGDDDDTVHLPNLGSDSCAVWTALVLEAGAVNVTSSLWGATDDGLAASCGGEADDPDIYFLVRVAAEGELAFALTSEQRVRAALFADTCPLREAPADCNTVGAASVDEGYYVIGVTGPADAVFTLRVQWTPAEPPAPEADGTCEAPYVVSLEEGANLISGNLEDATGKSYGSCTGGYRAALVYAIELDTAADLLVENAVGVYADLGFVLRRQSCTGGAEVGCASYYDDGLYAAGLEAGTYYLLVYDDGFGDASELTIRVERLPETPRPENDRCGGATPLTFTGDVAHATASFVAAEDDAYATTCGGDRGLYYSVSLATDSTLAIEVDHYDAATQLLAGTCPYPANLACHGYDSSWCSDVLDAGDYLIRVSEDWDPIRVPVTLTIERRDPPAAPANDACDAAPELDVTAGPATVAGTLRGAADDLTLTEASCVDPWGSIQGDEVFYALTLDEESDLVLGLSGSGTYDMQIGLVQGGCAGTGVLRCLQGPSWGDAMRLFNVTPGDYLVVIEYLDTPYSWDGCQSDTSGAFTLSVEATPSPPPPANDDCTSPTLLDSTMRVGATHVVTGTTRGATDDFTAVSCPGASSTVATPGHDVVYQVRTVEAGVLRASAISAFDDAMIQIAGVSCGSSSAMACSGSWGLPVAETSFTVAPGIYYIVVDQRQTWSDPAPGDFTLQVELLAP